EVHAVAGGLARGHESGQVFIGRAGGHDQHEIGAHYFGDGREVFGWVVVQVAVGCGRDADGPDFAQQQGVAVGGAAGHGLRGDLAAGAGAVFYYHALLQALAQLLRQRARDDVGAGAWREAYIQPDGRIRVLREAGHGQAQQDGRQQAAQDRLHGWSPWVWPAGAWPSVVLGGVGLRGDQQTR